MEHVVNCVRKIRSSNVQPGGTCSHHCAFKVTQSLMQFFACL